MFLQQALQRTEGELSLQLKLQLTKWMTYWKPQQISKAVMQEVSYVFIIKDLFLTNGKAEQRTVKQDRTTEDLWNHNLQLKLDLAHTKLELQRESVPNCPRKMVAAHQSRTSGNNPTPKTNPKRSSSRSQHTVQAKNSYRFFGRTSASRPDQRRARPGR